MKRCLFKLGLFLFLGAIVNVVLAQGFVVTQIRHLTDSNEIEITPWQVQWWEDHAPDGFLHTPEESSGVMTVRPGLTVILIDATSDSNWESVVLIRAGWPQRAIEGSEWSGSGLAVGDSNIRIAYDAILRSESDGKWNLPLRPIWPGFAINTIFYAALLWLLTLGSFTAPNNSPQARPMYQMRLRSA